MNPYDVLGVSKDASDQEIKRAYRKLSKKYHPDLNHEPGAEEKRHNMINLVQQVDSKALVVAKVSVALILVDLEQVALKIYSVHSLVVVKAEIIMALVKGEIFNMKCI